MQFFKGISDPEVPIDQGNYYVDLFFPALEELVKAVIITPTCDLVNQKAHFVKLVCLVALDYVIKIIAEDRGIGEEYFQSELEISQGQREKLLKAIRKNTVGDLLPRYSLIPKFESLVDYSFIDFQKVFVIPFEQFKRDYASNRRARMLSPWRESVTAQYAGYSMRVGTPRYTDDDLDDVLINAGIKLPRS